jgi:hypothetical protein
MVDSPSISGMQSTILIMRSSTAFIAPGSAAVTVSQIDRGRRLAAVWYLTSANESYGGTDVVSILLFCELGFRSKDNGAKTGDQFKFKCRKVVNYYAIRSTDHANPSCADPSTVRGSSPVSARAVSRVRSGGSQPWCHRSERAWGGDRRQLLATGMNAIHVKRVRAQGFGSPPLRRHR